MSLVKMSELLMEAKDKKIGIGAFSVGNMEMIIGAVAAAEYKKVPIILQIAEVRLKHSPIELIGPMMVAAARNAKVKVAVHLDHGLTIKTIEQALNIGFTSVMLDASREAFETNIKMSREVVAVTKLYGATVEAELGLVGGSEDGSEDHGVRCTRPEDAKIFCDQTGIDALAVAIGNAHGDYPIAPHLEFDVLKEISERVETPLVLHGGSGISAEDFRRAISLGIRKVNIATASFKSLTAKAEEYFKSGERHDYFGLNEAMVRGTQENVEKHIDIFNVPFL